MASRDDETNEMDQKKPLIKNGSPSHQPQKKKKISKTATKNEAAKKDQDNKPGTSSHPTNENVVQRIEPGELDKMRKWTIEQAVAEAVNIDLWISKNVISLLDASCTIPFIARYRKEMTGGLEAEKLREVQSACENIRNVQKKAANVIKTLEAESKLNPHLLEALVNSKTMAEVEYVYAPYKSTSKKSLAERARQLGLEETACQILEGSVRMCNIQMKKIINPEVKGLEGLKEIMNGWQHIIADIIAKNRAVLDYVRDVTSKAYDITIKSTKSAAAEKQDRQAYVEGKTTENFKFENYFDFSMSYKNIQAHQILALNRGEHLKVLTVKVIISDRIKNLILNFCRSEWLNSRKLKNPDANDKERKDFIEKCIQDAYGRLLEPHIVRHLRSELTKQAEKESIAVFSKNLKNLLLSPPVRGQVVLGIDPGFKHGCKLAVVSQTGAVLATDVIYPHQSVKKNSYESAEKLKHLITKYKCETIALGNGTACRETEKFLSDLIHSNTFSPMDVQYCIVNESGVSIYSVSKEASEELPDLDPNMRSAVGLARRLQDPLLEYVKVEPKHLGVGMYQHDIPATALRDALDSVVVECVSFVGVDLNVAPAIVLRKIAGLNATTAKNIVQWREANGPILNRSQLLVIKGIGPKSYEQCAGFVKILPETSRYKSERNQDEDEVKIEEESSARGKRKLKATSKSKKKTKISPSTDRNPLDMTIIHPESYDATVRFLQLLSLLPDRIGDEKFIAKVREYEKQGLEDMAAKIGIHTVTLQLIVDALKQPINYDFRTTLSKPLFRKSLCSMDMLEVGTTLTGRVTNVTHFGAFVDIGVGHNGLIHKSKMKMQSGQVQLGDRVEVKVISLHQERKRIGLELVRVM